NFYLDLWEGFAARPGVSLNGMRQVEWPKFSPIVTSS
ncbi:hypothetical protein A2U01_0048451, partial [Trifolium medium]|nr:hypothetical protein [Trifolium medium]